MPGVLGIRRRQGGLRFRLPASARQRAAEEGQRGRAEGSAAKDAGAAGSYVQQGAAMQTRAWGSGWFRVHGQQLRLPNNVSGYVENLDFSLN
jgi:hypothetical protein